ncbi:MAG: FmdE family protein [Methanospirillum sp.]
MTGTRSFEDAVSFHGHRCPGLALGYRAAGVGLAALDADPADDEEVVAVVENDACGVDGLQVRTGGTFGKGNLRVLDYGKHVYTFYERSSGRGVRVATRPDFSTARFDPGFAALRDRVQGGTATPDERDEYERRLHAVCDAILAAPADELFVVTPIAGPPPEPARIHRSVPCDECGESVAEHRLVERDGKRLCIPCARR